MIVHIYVFLSHKCTYLCIMQATNKNYIFAKVIKILTTFMGGSFFLYFTMHRYPFCFIFKACLKQKVLKWERTGVFAINCLIVLQFYVCLTEDTIFCSSNWRHLLPLYVAHSSKKCQVRVFGCKKLPRRQAQEEPVSVLSLPEMSGCGNGQRR